MLFQRSLNGSHTAQLLLQERFGVPVSLVEWLDRIFEIVKVAELMGNCWEDKGHCASNRLFAVRNDPFDRNLEGLQKLLDFLQESGDISLCTAEERSRQKDFFGQALTHHPQDLVAHIRLQAIQSQDHPTLLRRRVLIPP